MNPENANQPKTSPDNQPDIPPSVIPTASSNGEKVIQPSENIRQELQAQQQAQPQVTQPTPRLVQNQPPGAPLNVASINPSQSPVESQVGISASQMGYNQPKNKLFDISPRQLIVKGLIVLVVLGGIFTALIMTNIIALSEFKNIDYTTSNGAKLKLDFYSKHGTKQGENATTNLVSKVPREGNFPIKLSISELEGMETYNRTKDCSTHRKVTNAQNTNLNQNLSVCDFRRPNDSFTDGVYVSVFKHNEKSYMVTITNDLDKIDLTSQNNAKESLSKMGLKPYKTDIEKILSSIKVE